MHGRTAELIQQLDLQPHPEGGFFAEAFRAGARVQPRDDRDTRAALSVIYFLLAEGGISRWHRVRSDEVWQHVEGSPLEVISLPGEGGVVQRHILGPLAESAVPLHVVPAGWWQAARPLGAYSLVACTVGPGFEYADFELLSDVPEGKRPAFSPSSLLDAYL